MITLAWITASLGVLFGLFVIIDGIAYDLHTTFPKATGIFLLGFCFISFIVSSGASIIYLLVHDSDHNPPSEQRAEIINHTNYVEVRFTNWVNYPTREEDMP